ncbi:MAG: biotin--[acetyl-CoA-carboxylase] ligase [Rubrivivax sp.]
MTPAPTLEWSAAALQAELQALQPGLAVEVLAEDASTNTTLLARARQAGGNGAAWLLVAEHQSAGRGRMGRAWYAARGDSLTFSLGLRRATVQGSGLSLAVGVALAEALDPSGRSIGLKWPNDLWLRGTQPGSGRKLGGILIETASAERGRVCVVGVGLNVRAPGAPAGAPAGREGREGQPAFATGVAGLCEIDEQASAPRVLRRVAEPLLRAWLRFEREGLAPFLGAFEARDLLRGQRVTTTLAGLPTGTAIGVDADGALRVRDEAGRLHRVSAGEVSVRPERAAEAA